MGREFIIRVTLKGASAPPNCYDIAALKCLCYFMESFSHRVRPCLRLAVAAMHLSDGKVKAVCRQMPCWCSLSGLDIWHSKVFFFSPWKAFIKNVCYKGMYSMRYLKQYHTLQNETRENTQICYVLNTCFSSELGFSREAAGKGPEPAAWPGPAHGAPSDLKVVVILYPSRYPTMCRLLICHRFLEL